MEHLNEFQISAQFILTDQKQKVLVKKWVSERAFLEFWVSSSVELIMTIPLPIPGMIHGPLFFLHPHIRELEVQKNCYFLYSLSFCESQASVFDNLPNSLSANCSYCHFLVLHSGRDSISDKGNKSNWQQSNNCTSNYCSWTERKGTRDGFCHRPTKGPLKLCWHFKFTPKSTIEEIKLVLLCSTRFRKLK